MSFEGFNAAPVTFNFNDTRLDSPGPNIWAPRISSAVPAYPVNGPFGTPKKSVPGFQLGTTFKAQGTSLSSDMGHISRSDSSPVVDDFVSGPQQAQRLSNILSRSIQNLKVAAASPPGLSVDSEFGTTASNFQQSLNFNTGNLMDVFKPRPDPFTGFGSVGMRVPTGPANRNQFISRRFDNGRASPAGKSKPIALNSKPQPPPRFIELLGLLMESQSEHHGPVMHASAQAFDTFVFVRVPVDELRIRVVREIFQEGGQILKTNFIWETEDGRKTMVRVGQENWHRILNSVKGDDYQWLADIWKTHVRRQPERLSFFEECNICKAEDAENHPNAGANQMLVVYDVDDRPFNFRHILRNQPHRGGAGIEVIAD